MTNVRGHEEDPSRASAAGVATLVMSQHDAVRRHLVAYLRRSASLTVSGDAFSAEAIIQAQPGVLVLDLSQLGQQELRQAIDAAKHVDARLIALASMCEPEYKQAVVDAGGLYRLKSLGVDGLAEVVRDVATQAEASARTRRACRSTAGRRSDNRRRARPSPSRAGHPF
jgi:DNA-binding NarL/FixJ family response regulator